MQKFYALMTLLIGCTMSSATLAVAPRYTLADAYYEALNDPSGSGFDSDHALGLDGSYALTDHWVAMAAYAHENADFNLLGVNGTVSGDAFGLGLGYRFPLTASLDIVPNVSYVTSHATAETSGIHSSSSEDGYDAELQLRDMVTDQFELDGTLDHISMTGSSNSVGIAALYGFTSAFAIGMSYSSSRSSGENTSGWTLALRYYFR